MKRLLALGILLAAPGSVLAQGPALHARTAGDLAELCAQTGKDAAGLAKVQFCQGYAQATIDGELRRAVDKKPFCFPNPAPSRLATMAEFAQWVRANASSAREPSQEVLIRFMGQKFPCR